MLKSLAYYPNAIKNLSYPFLQTTAWKQQRADSNSVAIPVSALSIEFVAKPEEARLVTVVTLWAGDDRAKCCSQNVPWVHALLAPFLDRSCGCKPW
jgi:hypothetical protein